MSKRAAQRIIAKVQSKAPLPLRRPSTSNAARLGSETLINITGNYTKEELQEYKDVFALFDKENAGAIANAELEAAMNSMGLRPSKNEIENLIKEVDVDGNGEIDFDEFCLVMKKLTQKKDTEEETIRMCFDVFDQDGDGIVSEEEFRDICVELGGLTEQQIDYVFRDADVAGNNKLDYDEFTQMARTYLFDDELAQYDDDESDVEQRADSAVQIDSEVE